MNLCSILIEAMPNTIHYSVPGLSVLPDVDEYAAMRDALALRRTREETRAGKGVRRGHKGTVALSIDN